MMLKIDHHQFTLKDKKLTAKFTKWFGVNDKAPDRLLVVGKKHQIEFVQLVSDNEDVYYYSPTIDCLTKYPQCRGYRVILEK